MLRFDFANEIVGGGSLAYGCVQEEIMFTICPELTVSRLMCPRMQPGESIVIVGTEQFSVPEGYAFGLRYGGPYDDPTPRDEQGRLQSFVAALDALDLRGQSKVQQSEPTTHLINMAPWLT